VVSPFDEAEEEAAAATTPLAVRVRPRNLDEVIGQKHLTGSGTQFRKLIDAGAQVALVAPADRLWGDLS
jgi:putative ATPase